MNYEYNEENFNKIIEEFTKLNNDLKRKKIIEDLQFLILYQSKLCMLNNTEFNIMHNREMDDINFDKVEEKDFLEALYAYIYILKSANFKFVSSLTNKLSELTKFKK